MRNPHPVDILRPDCREVHHGLSENDRLERRVPPLDVERRVGLREPRGLRLRERLREALSGLHPLDDEVARSVEHTLETEDLRAEQPGPERREERRRRHDGPLEKKARPIGRCETPQAVEVERDRTLVRRRHGLSARERPPDKRHRRFAAPRVRDRAFGEDIVLRLADEPFGRPVRRRSRKRVEGIEPGGRIGASASSGRDADERQLPAAHIREASALVREQRTEPLPHDAMSEKQDSGRHPVPSRVRTPGGGCSKHPRVRASSSSRSGRRPSSP